MVTDVRWESPFKRTIPYNLFLQHFTELNKIYWAHVPAASTIEKNAIKELGDEFADPRGYFLINDEDDRRMASTFKDWKKDYREFGNYTRLSMVMLLSSCLETYLRTVVSLAIESKPGCVIGCKDAIDGLFLLRERNGYGEVNTSLYQFENVIESICKGDWYSRIANYEKYFGKSPIKESGLKELEELRQKRNIVGHYFGRIKQKYEAPLSLSPLEAERVSHKKLLNFLKITYDSVKCIDEHLHVSFIGSYDICKYFYMCLQVNQIKSKTIGQQAKDLQKILGDAGMPPVGTTYYKNLIAYMNLESKDDLCRYNKQMCISLINKKMLENDIVLLKNGKAMRLGGSLFNSFIKAYNLRQKKDFCRVTSYGNSGYFYSSKTIDFIYEKIRAHPSEILDELNDLITGK